ncbi:MarR family winged helix-turn-helix transcriptional regulator [Demequina aurantiaca]|uniref:MarR family winged helix-turn-helix transcriptional regulator n=1 Tax=Demequina aurantiaca TaxID=676200 RepID=UPI0007807202|nr:MarR family transcriptional regulator [Demequina aurantiaca]
MTSSRDAASAAITATVTSSRALLGIVARSMSGALEELSLVQFRLLVVLDSAGPQRMGDLAVSLGVHPSTLSRTVDRLEAGGWISREVSAESRREVIVAVSDKGHGMVAEVTRTRRRAIASVLRDLDPADREAVRIGMTLFAEAAGEPSAPDMLTLGL